MDKICLFLFFVFSFDNLMAMYQTRDRNYGILDGRRSIYNRPVVDVQVYYESHCPACKEEFKTQLVPLLEKFGDSVHIEVHPYGNAETSFVNGHYEFESQHGPKETYGNKLHACALRLIGNNTLAIKFNSFMMDPTFGEGSDDYAADMSGRYLNVDSQSIKACAKSEIGSQLLAEQGVKTSKIYKTSIPTCYINGKMTNSEDIYKEVYAIIKNGPILY